MGFKNALCVGIKNLETFVPLLQLLVPGAQADLFLSLLVQPWLWCQDFGRKEQVFQSLTFQKDVCLITGVEFIVCQGRGPGLDTKYSVPKGR